MANVIFKSDGLDGFKKRVLENARALDRGETLPSETTYSFESPNEMLKVLTQSRINLLERLSLHGRQPVTLLARDLRRNRAAVIRDLGVLRRIGVVHTTMIRSAPKPVFYAEPLAKRVDFVCSIHGAKTSSGKA